jgi:RNA polymerase-interacting CarD/CdnL/TRCF family regulator
MAAGQLKDQEQQTRFRPGTVVVHPAYGFCRIAAIQHARLRDGLEDCYVFRMGSARNPIKVLVPVAQAEEAGIRRPITRQEADAILEVFRMAATPVEPRTKEQLDDVPARLNSTDLLQVAETIRDLAAAGVKGWTGAADGAFVNHRRSEQALLTQALSRLIEEIAHVQRIPLKEVEGQIRKRLERTRQRDRAHATTA